MSDRRNPTTLAWNVVDKIVKDVRDRSGLREEWDGIDTVARREIREGWVRLIVDAMADQNGPRL
jgi:hypothetical protein